MHLTCLIASDKFQSTRGASYHPTLMGNCQESIVLKSEVFALSIQSMVYSLVGTRVGALAGFQSVMGVSDYLIERQLPDFQPLYILILIFEWVAIK